MPSERDGFPWELAVFLFLPLHKELDRVSRKRSGKPNASSPSTGVDTPLRIIGGKYGGRKVQYSGDRRTRPMKDRLREAIFNLLGPQAKGMHAVDLFAGTGALGLEALSRGATQATFVEQHFPSAALIRRSVQELGIEEPTEVIGGDTFIWAQRTPELSELPWVLFASPPYSFYVDRQDDMLLLLTTLIQRAPTKSIVIVEADGRFDMNLLPQTRLAWRVRSYPPAAVALGHIT